MKTKSKKCHSKPFNITICPHVVDIKQVVYNTIPQEFIDVIKKFVLKGRIDKTPVYELLPKQLQNYAKINRYMQDYCFANDIKVNINGFNKQGSKRAFCFD